MKRKLSRWLPMVLSILIVCSMGMSVFADDGYVDIPDFSKTGSISVVLKEMKTKAPVVGLELAIYQVADATFDDGDAVFVYTETFNECTEPLDLADPEALAESFAAYVKAHRIQGQTIMMSDNEGKLEFGSLKTGLYLIMQNRQSEDYTSLKPFLVSLPLLVDDTYIYDVDASPKVGTVTKIDKPEKPPVKPEKPQTPPGSKLPQTGQLWWPVCLLAVAGVLCFTFGWTRKRKYHNNI